MWEKSNAVDKAVLESAANIIVKVEDERANIERSESDARTQG